MAATVFALFVLTIGVIGACLSIVAVLAWRAIDRLAESQGWW